jgi:RNA polymerase subunit RPABC4/transcription elongation factor Spt4
MNAYIFHMLMQAREYKADRQKKIIFGPRSNVCPFCTHDFLCSNWEVMTGIVEPEDMELTCWRCPLLSAIKVEDVRMVMEYCERMGKHMLENYEQYFDGGDTAWD